MIEIRPVEDIGEIQAGDNLGAVLAGALARMRPVFGDVLVVTQKIFSKAEGRMVDLATVSPGGQAIELASITDKDPRLIELILSESTAVVRAKRGVLITRHRLGFVMANSGIDCSNIGKGSGDYALLLPLDPDRSAAALQTFLLEQLGVRMGIVMSDSFGRPWRNGVVNVAIGACGIPAIYDKRGMPDRDGRILQVTQVAYGDLFASAAGLLMGEADEGVPAVLIRGCPLPREDVPAAKLIRNLEEDLFQ